MLAMTRVRETHLTDVGHDEGVLWQAEASNLDLAESPVEEAGGCNVCKPKHTYLKYTKSVRADSKTILSPFLEFIVKCSNHFKHKRKNTLGNFSF